MSVTNSNHLAQILIVNHGIVSPTPNVNPTLFVNSCNLFDGDYRFTMLQLLVTHQVIFHPHFNHPWQYFITSCWQEEVGFFGQWMSSSIIIDKFCSLIHKTCHPKSYHSDIKYHTSPKYHIECSSSGKLGCLKCYSRRVHGKLGLDVDSQVELLIPSTQEIYINQYIITYHSSDMYSFACIMGKG